MRSPLFGLLAGALILAFAPLASSPAWASPIVATQLGPVRGLAVDGGSAFRKIPFAQPPVGDLRWRRPAPPTAWKGVRDATSFSLPCAQPDLGWNGVKETGSSEDCLYLNVWTPAASAKSRRPVMVWIHGGAFEGGSGVDPTFDGAALMRHGVVVVTINYRLGVLGFLTHPDLDAESTRHTSGDYGFYDQLAALRWVQANIARFGGDPRKVTLFGQSAGSASVAALMTSPLSRGLFHQSIMESGAPIGIGALQTTAQTEAGTRNWGSIAELRKMPASDLIASWRKYAAADPRARAARPVVDGDVIPVSPDVAFATGGVRKMASIIGNNAREALGPPNKDMMLRAFGPNAGKAAAIYDAASADPIEGDGTAQLATDTSFRCPTVMTQSFRAAAGNAVYAYQFGQSLPGREAMGAGHTFELPFVFGNLSPSGFLGGNFSPADHELSRQMQAYWTNFAKTGDPNGPGLPRWNRFEPAAADYMVFIDGGTHDAQGLHAGVCSLYRQTWADEHHLPGGPT